MRMWMCDPKLLYRKHLLGEHGEIHKFKHTFVKKHKKDKYIENNCIEPSSMQKRHDELAEELLRRGYNHQSPFEAPDISYLPEDQRNYKVDVKTSLKDLCERCPDCRARIEVLNEQ